MAHQMLPRLLLFKYFRPANMVHISRKVVHFPWLFNRFHAVCSYVMWLLTKPLSLKVCRVELCTELFYAIVPTLYLCFLLICYPLHLVRFLMFFFLFLATRCPGIQSTVELHAVLSYSVTLVFFSFSFQLHHQLCRVLRTRKELVLCSLVLWMTLAMWH